MRRNILMLMILMACLVSTIIEAPVLIEGKEIFKPVIYSIKTSEIGGKAIKQTSLDEFYPCYLQPDATMLCPTINSTNLITLSLKANISKGIPLTDFRKPIYETTEVANPLYDKKLKPDPEDIRTQPTITTQDFKGYATSYIDYTKNQVIILDISQDGELSIGFGSNNVSITSFTTGWCMNCTNASSGIILKDAISSLGELCNVSANICDNLELFLPFSPETSTSTSTADLSGNGRNALVNSSKGTLIFNYSYYIQTATADGVSPGIYNVSYNINASISTSCMWVKMYPATYRDFYTAFHMEANAAGTQEIVKLYYSNSTSKWILTNDYGATATAAAATPTNEYHFICGVMNMPVNALLYVDNLAPVTDSSVTMNGNLTRYAVGKQTNGVRNMNGEYTIVMVWSRILTASEISALYNVSVYLKFGNYTANTSLDATYKPANATWTCNSNGQNNCTMWVSADNVTGVNCLATPCDISSLANTNILYWNALLSSSNQTKTPEMTSINFTYTAVTNTCTAPASGNWSINSTHGCNETNCNINLYPNGIFYTDSGSIYFHNCNLTLGFFKRLDSGTSTIITLVSSRGLIYK